MGAVLTPGCIWLIQFETKEIFTVSISLLPIGGIRENPADPIIRLSTTECEVSPGMMSL